MPIQTIVNKELPIGVPGEFFDDSPRKVHAYALGNNSDSTAAVGVAYSNTKDIIIENSGFIYTKSI